MSITSEYYKEHRPGAAREGFYAEGCLSFRVRELTEVAPLFDELVAAGESSSAHARVMAGKMGMAGEDLLVGRQRVSVDVKVTFGIEPLGP
ncbi:MULTISPECIES: hypothetical protein [Sorangium]|uniref:hypothetical protein n=1 Tax=Sorangium TaxID=39643 RepID=UPI003D9C5EC5